MAQELSNEISQPPPRKEPTESGSDLEKAKLEIELLKSKLLQCFFVLTVSRFIVYFVNTRVEEQGAGGLKAAAEAMSKAVNKTVREKDKKIFYSNAEVYHRSLQHLPHGYTILRFTFFFYSVQLCLDSNPSNRKTGGLRC